MNKWFELNWLRKETKHISVPELVIDSGVSKASATYFWPANEEVLIKDKFYDCKNGIIAINADSTIMVSSLAHEWRHHVQYYYHGSSCKSTAWKNKKNYKKEIIDYFTNNIWEMDALLYEIKKAPDDVNLQWYEWIIKNENK